MTKYEYHAIPQSMKGMDTRYLYHISRTVNPVKGSFETNYIGILKKMMIPKDK